MITKSLEQIREAVECAKNAIVNHIQKNGKITITYSHAIILDDNDPKENFGVATTLSIDNDNEIVIETSDTSTFYWATLSLSEKVSVICEAEIVINP